MLEEVDIISKTSIVISTYNDSKYLHRLLPSILNQTLKPLEIIVVDDGSKDDSAEEIILSYANSTKIPIIFQKKKNGGPSSARNTGFHLAKGEFILFIDADDELLPDSIEWRQNKLQSLGVEYASVYCSSLNSFQNKLTIKEQVTEFNGSIDGSLLGRAKGIPGGSPYHFFRKEVLIHVNGYNESLKFNEDFELILRIGKEWLFFGENKPGFIRHIRKNSWSKSDPYNSYDGVERFLTLAWNNQLLSKKEINKRRKENNLSIVKKLLLKKKNWNDVEPFIDNAFHIENPKNVKEFVLFFINKFIKIFRNARS